VSPQGPMTVPVAVEPGGRAITGAIRWRLRLGVGFAASYFSPLYAYRELEGVAWDCPSCNTSGSVTLLSRYGRRFWFSCSQCRWEKRYLRTEAERLSAELLSTSR